ncbi:MAG: GNAT family N-acetyltransferase [Geminicoccaceae bacterium]
MQALKRDAMLPDPDLIRRIERAALWAWPPRETRWLDGWLLRAGGAHSRRLNSVQTLEFASTWPLDRQVAEVEAWYADRGLPACFHLADGAQPDELASFLEAQGYSIRTPTHVATAPLPVPGSPVPRDALVDLHHRPIQSVTSALADPRWPDAIRRERAALYARIRPAHRFALATVGGEPAAAGLCVVQDGLAGIFAMRTQAPYRRRGLARHLLTLLAGWAAEAGAGTLYLQVEEGNEAALALYGAFGFERRYGYRYLER